MIFRTLGLEVGAAVALPRRRRPSHPSAVLRSGDPAAEAQAFSSLVSDLTLAREALQARPA